MKHDLGQSAGVCEFTPGAKDTCDRCDGPLRRVYWVRTSHECDEGDYICAACFRAHTYQLYWWERLRDLLKLWRCHLGLHRWYNHGGDDFGYSLVLCADCWVQKSSPNDDTEKTR